MRGRPLYKPRPAPSGFLALEKSGDYRHEPVERRPGCAAAAFAVPLLAPWHPRNGSGAGSLRRCPTGYADRHRADRARALARHSGSANFCVGERDGTSTGTFRHRVIQPTARYPWQGHCVKANIKSPAELLKAGKALTLSQVADGAEGLVLADLARAIAAGKDAPAISLAVICRGGQRMAALSRSLAFFGPDLQVMEFPAWDCLPYDRVSPNAAVVAQRMTALSRLARVKGRDKPSLVLTTVNAGLQRVPSRNFVATHALSVAPGNVIGMQGVIEWLELN